MPGPGGYGACTGPVPGCGPYGCTPGPVREPGCCGIGFAIGDSVRTDLKGAHDLGVDCLFVTAGIHAEELGHRDDPDLATLGEMFAKAGHAPKAVTRKLVL